MSAIARAMEVARSNLYEKRVPRSLRTPAGDVEALAALKSVVGTRCTYGYRRAAAVANRGICSGAGLRARSEACEIAVHEKTRHR